LEPVVKAFKIKSFGVSMRAERYARKSAREAEGVSGYLCPRRQAPLAMLGAKRLRAGRAWVMISHV
jgi:hypothetical protein